MSTLAVGIDLGTTYSCVGVMRNGKVEIIASDQGNRTTPSCVAFTDDESLVGDAAKNQAAMNAKNTVFDAKRLIGRSFNDADVQQDMKLWPFAVVNVDGKPEIQVQYKGATKTFKPEAISAMVIRKMVDIAESFLGSKVPSVVITCPAYFNDAQRQATKDAGTIAQVNVLRVINEPTAAAIAYGLDDSTKKSNKPNTVMIFDYGGGTFDVSILVIDDGVFEVKATAGDTHAGGCDLDNALVSHFVDEFKKKYKKDLTISDRAIRRLLTSCERAKRTLSSQTVATVEIDSLFEGMDFQSSITRAKYEDLCMSHFRKCLVPVEKVIADAKMGKGDIDEIILVGGSSRTPKVQELLRNFFNGKELCKSINPDEAVAYGAAVQAAILTGVRSEATDKMLLIDVNPLSLGIATNGVNMTNIVNRSSVIPCKQTKTFSTSVDNQPAVTIEIFEGERPMTKNNHALGKFTLNGIPPMPRGQPQIEVTFDIDANGILNVSASEKSTGASHKITITNDSGRLSAEEIDKMVKDAELNKEQDIKFQEYATGRQKVEQQIAGVRSALDDPKLEGQLGADDRAEMESIIKDGDAWLSTHPESSPDEYDSKSKEIQTRCVQIITKLKSETTDEVPTSSGSSARTGAGPKVEEVD